MNYESRRAEQRKEKKEEGKEQKLSLFPASTVMKHDFQYLVLAAGVHTKVIFSSSSSDDHSAGELSYFPAVMETAAHNCPSMDAMLGGGLYAARSICSVVEKHGVKPYLPPKSNSSFRSHGVRSWASGSQLKGK